MQKARHDHQVYASPFSCQLVRSGRRSLLLFDLRFKATAKGRFRFPSSTCGIVVAGTCSALGDVSFVPAGGDAPLLEDLAQVSAVEGFVEEVLEHHATV